MRPSFPRFDIRVRTLVFAITSASLLTAFTLTNAATPGRADPPFAANGALTLEPMHTLAPLRLVERGRCPAFSAVREVDDGYDGRISDSFAADSFFDTTPTQPEAENFTLPAHTAANPETPTARTANDPPDAACADAPTVRLILAPASASNPAPAVFDPEGFAGTATKVNFMGAGAVEPSLSQSPNAPGTPSPFDTDGTKGWIMPAKIVSRAGGYDAVLGTHLAPVASAGIAEPSFAPVLHRMAALAPAAGSVAGLLPQVNSPSAGAAYAWGDNTYGQLGNGSNGGSSSTPGQVTGLTSGVTAIAAGGIDSLAIQNGAVYAWGYNGDGELGNGTTDSSPTPVQVTGLTSGVTAIAGGNDSNLAIQNGAAKSWGDNSSGELGNGKSTSSSTPVQVTGLTSGVTAISAGYFFDLAVQNGAAKSWGMAYYGTLGNGKTTNSSTPVQVTGLTSGVTAVAAGYLHGLALQNGAVKAWGNNQFGQLGNGTNNNTTTPVAAVGLPGGVTAIAAGGRQSLAVANGNVYAWGDNQYGELGNGTTDSSPTPLEIDPADLKSITAVAASSLSSYALSSDGSLWVWGDNTSGELGLGTDTQDYLTPQHLLPPSGFAYTAIDADADDNFADAILTQVPEPATWLGGALLAGAALTAGIRVRV